MCANFPKTLALLRKERNLSQRQVAKELGISQALLSHYENGIREPGLDFVVQACDFYGVSADYLLGRSLNRDGTTILDADTLYDATSERDNVLKGSVLSTLSKKLLVNSIGVLFDILGKLGDKRAIKAAAAFLSVGVYRLYRDLTRVSPHWDKDYYVVPDGQFANLTRVDMLLSEAEYIEALSTLGKDVEFPDVTPAALMERYPSGYQSLFQIIHSSSERMNAQFEQHKKASK